jgi:steroid delta-isomerase-like uncharacterized protein
MAETNTAAETKPKTPRSRRTKRKIVEDHARSYFEAVAERDPEKMSKHWADDVVEDVPGVGVLRGPAAIKAFFREMFAALPDLETTAQRVVADDTRAVVEWRMGGTFSGAPYQGIEPNGRHVELRGLDLFEIEKQKITSNTVYFDTSEFARQIGMLPPQDSGAERAMKGAFNAVTKLRKAVNERMGS